MAEITYLEAIREALSEEMERDANVFCMGEDIGAYGGAFKVTEGLAALDEAERALRDSEDRPSLVRTLNRRSVARRFLGKYAEALEDASEALRLAEGPAGLRPERAEAMRAIGMSLYQLGRLNEAIDWFSRSLEAYRDLDDRQSAAVVVMEQGLAYAGAGRYRRALEDYRQALTEWRAAGNVSGLANLLNNLGVLLSQMGEYEQAAEALEEALSCARQVGYGRLEAYILASIADLYADLQAASAAKDASGQARALATRLNDPFLLLYIDLAWASWALNQGDPAEARRLVEATRQAAQESGSLYEKSLWHQVAGRLDLAEDQASAAGHFRQAAEGFEVGGQQAEAARACFFLAVTQFIRGESAEAFANLERAFKWVANLDSQHILVASGQQAGAPAGQL